MLRNKKIPFKYLLFEHYKVDDDATLNDFEQNKKKIASYFVGAEYLLINKILLSEMNFFCAFIAGFLKVSRVLTPFLAIIGLVSWWKIY